MWQRGWRVAGQRAVPSTVTLHVQPHRPTRPPTPTLSCPAPVPPPLPCRPLKPLIYLTLAPTIGLSCYMQWGNSDLAPLLGVAWDCGGVTTGPVTVPVSAADALLQQQLPQCQLVLKQNRWCPLPTWAPPGADSAPSAVPGTPHQCHARPPSHWPPSTTAQPSNLPTSNRRSCWRWALE